MSLSEIQILTIAAAHSERGGPRRAANSPSAWRIGYRRRRWPPIVRRSSVSAALRSMCVGVVRATIHSIQEGNLVTSKVWTIRVPAPARSRLIRQSVLSGNRRGDGAPRDLVHHPYQMLAQRAALPAMRIRLGGHGRARSEEIAAQRSVHDPHHPRVHSLGDGRHLSLPSTAAGKKIEQGSIYHKLVLPIFLGALLVAPCSSPLRQPTQQVTPGPPLRPLHLGELADDQREHPVEPLGPCGRVYPGIGHLGQHVEPSQS